jgi:hypothetical protein
VEPSRQGQEIEALRRRGVPIRRLRARRQRFSRICFTLAGGAFGTAIYLVRTRLPLLLEPAHLPLALGLVAVMAALFVLGSSAESEIGRLDEDLADLDAEIVRLLKRRP